MPETLPPSFLFDLLFDVPALALWPEKVELEAWETLAPLPPVQQLDERKPPIEVRLGWHADGLLVAADVRGKSVPPKAEPLHTEGDDCIVVGLDTRNTKSISRANQFCHRFHFTPADELSELDPDIEATLLPRATADAPIVSFSRDDVAAALYDDGYRIVARLRAEALNGYDPSFSDRLGFHVEVADREWGNIPLWGDARLAGGANPAQWATLRLQPAS